MGKTDATLYTCDGCRATSTVRTGQRADGFRSIEISGQEKWLCTICHSAVEWVVRFQGITVPPRVHRGTDGRFALRRKS